MVMPDQKENKAKQERRVQLDQRESMASKDLLEQLAKKACSEAEVTRAQRATQPS